MMFLVKNMRKSPICLKPNFSKRTITSYRNSCKDLPPIGKLNLNNKRSATLPANKILDIIAREAAPEINYQPLGSPKPILLPLKKSVSTNSFKYFNTLIKTRFKHTDVNSKKIPQEDFFLFFKNKIPTFEFVREKNLSRKKNRILREVVTILEEDQEHHINE